MSDTGTTMGNLQFNIPETSASEAQALRPRMFVFRDTVLKFLHFSRGHDHNHNGFLFYASGLSTQSYEKK